MLRSAHNMVTGQGKHLSHEDAIKVLLGYTPQQIAAAHPSGDPTSQQPHATLVAPDPETEAVYRRLIDTVDQVVQTRQTQALRGGAGWPRTAEIDPAAVLVEAGLLHHLKAATRLAERSDDEFLLAVAFAVILNVESRGDTGGLVVSPGVRVRWPDPRILLQDRIWIEESGSWQELDELDRERLAVVGGHVERLERPCAAGALVYVTAGVLGGQISIDEGRRQHHLINLLGKGWTDWTPLGRRLKHLTRRDTA